MKDELAEFLKVPFNRYLIFGLIALGAILFISEQAAPPVRDNATLVVDFFFSPTCPHCAAQEPFNQQLEQEFPQMRIVRHDVTRMEEAALLLSMAENLSINPATLGTPTTFVQDRFFIGFESAETTGEEIRSAVRECLQGSCGNQTEREPPTISSLLGSFDLPVVGKTDISQLPLPFLAITLGLVDGFNPCAMWVLVYLISLVIEMNDRKRLWLIVGSFVLASGILYFIFMTAWLHLFLFLGYFRPLIILVGLVALGGGALSVKEYVDTKGAMVCKVTGAEDKKRLSSNMKELISAPLTWITLVGIVVLAFTVNSIEFVCSSAIPAVFTQVLAMSKLSWIEYYGYILLYDLFFMLDDMLVFGSAVLVYSNTGEKYERYCKIIGGAILLLLGFMLLFAPQVLR